MALGPRELTSALESQAQELGFVRMGVAKAQALEPEGSWLRTWLASGRSADMDYMERTADVRCDPRHEGMLADAVSIVVLATPYGSTPGCKAAPGRMARYARGRDYHNVLGKRMRKLSSFLQDHGHATRAAVDSMPVFERAWAQRAGVGFVGKNCCLIIPGVGSHVFLSVLVTRAELVESEPMASRCGECRACLDACPTQAFVTAHELDARRCISYLTIENRGSIEPTLRSSMGDWIFGCDACQDVCPFNRTPRSLETDSAFAEQRFSRPAHEYLCCTEDEFRSMAEGSPLRRAGRAGMARNAAIVLGNHGDKRHLPILQRAADVDVDPVVREAAAWAMAQIKVTQSP